MFTLLHKFRSGFYALAITLFVSLPVLAEDIEIYTKDNLGSGTVVPNIMLILDTSYSMTTLLTINENYVPATNYSTRAGNCFDNNRMYVFDLEDNIDCSPTYRNNYYDLTLNSCKAMSNAFDVVGHYTSTFAQWRDNTNVWTSVGVSRTDPDFVIECNIDQGVHGADDAAAAKYIDIIGGTSPYTTSSTNSDQSWGNIASGTLRFATGNYMNYKVTSTDFQTSRLEVMKDVIRNLVYGVDGVNIGLMRFDDRVNNDADGSRGGAVRYEVQDITASRANMISEMNTWGPSDPLNPGNASTAGLGWTPLSETMFEAFRYFSGGEVLFGKAPNIASIGGSTDTFSGGTKHYKSPVDPDYADCQKQFVIMLSDGVASKDTQADSLIEGLTGFVGTGDNGVVGQCTGSGDGHCLDDLAGYMNKRGFGVEYKTSSDDIDSGVFLNTYTVGFAGDIPMLEDAAREGGGEYYVAYSSSDLLDKLVAIINEIKSIHTTFSSPAVSVNAFNRTTHRSDLYFTLFKPSNKAHWDGNFKRFKLTFDNGIPSIVDVNGDPAISPITGFFKETSRSYWTADADAPDGKSTEVGGAASMLFAGSTLATSRKVYSDINSGLLTNTNNRIEDNNTDITEAMLGVPDAATRTKLIDWIRGIDVLDKDGDNDTTDARRQMGDPLHAQPALVEYADGATTDPEIVAYVVTNDGYLHAFDTRTSVATAGQEKFAFVPKDMLPDMLALYNNSGTDKHYGLDGSVVSYINDVDKDGIIETGDKVMIYFGMRRGGRNYYALDVTDPDAPELKWTIKGGMVNTGLGDYTELGQTWSTPAVRKIRLNGADVDVLIFAGGYDLDQDTASINVRSSANENMGRGIFIVNALTGELLWRMGPDNNADLQDSNMAYSIPSDIAAADASGDGYVDHLYVGDMGGQLWRVDINNNLGETESNIDNIISGGRIADLADNTQASNRRFFYPPDVAILKDSSDQVYLSVLITSGNRAHPINKNVQDRVFMIRDLPVTGKPTSYVTITENDSTHDLYNTTANLIGEGTDAEKTVALTSMQGKKGWFIDFDASVGEKGLTKPLIFGGEAFFATYVPRDTTVTATGCEPDEGTGYLYHINVENGTPVKNYDLIVSPSNEALTKEDRKQELTRSGIPADPTLVIPDDGAAVCVGTECNKAEGIGTHKRVFWFEE